MKKYFQDIFFGISSILQGMRLTFRHLWAARKQHDASNVFSPDYFKQDTGLVTLSYPYEKLPLPDHGRYQLYNEIDDCIVCDKCAVICPVNCIAIDAIKSPEPIGETSDGSVKRLYAATFDIDMAKCCFCGLCTSVCPTECLTMTNTYDFSTFTVKEMNFEFANLSKEEADEKRKKYEQYMLEKEQAKQAQALKPETTIASAASPPVLKPKINFGKPAIPTPAMNNEEVAKSTPSETPAEPKPTVAKPSMPFKPVIKVPVIKKPEPPAEH